MKFSLVFLIFCSSFQQTFFFLILPVFYIYSTIWQDKRKMATSEKGTKLVINKYLEAVGGGQKMDKGMWLTK